jgi:hypothetical protein
MYDNNFGIEVVILGSREDEGSTEGPSTMPHTNEGKRSKGSG